MAYYSYLLAPFIIWLITGICKFIINSIRAGRLAFDLIGYGGLPSNHSAIVSGMTTLIGLKEGIADPAFGVAITLAFIVILDAFSLRQQIGKHAAMINKLTAEESPTALRERIGHTKIEIAAGIIVGVISAIILSKF